MKKSGRFHGSNITTYKKRKKLAFNKRMLELQILTVVLVLVRRCI
jgi:hypothetical protein